MNVSFRQSLNPKRPKNRPRAPAAHVSLSSQYPIVKEQTDKKPVKPKPTSPSQSGQNQAAPGNPRVSLKPRQLTKTDRAQNKTPAALKQKSETVPRQKRNAPVDDRDIGGDEVKCQRGASNFYAFFLTAALTYRQARTEALLPPGQGVPVGQPHCGPIPSALRRPGTFASRLAAGSVGHHGLAPV